MSKKFNHLNIPSHWQSYWTRFPEGHTILEALIQWVSQVDEMVDSYNKLTDHVDNFKEAVNNTTDGFREELDTFLGQFDDNLAQNVIATLSEWQQSGFLEIVIDQALDTKYHEMDDRLTTGLNDFSDLILTRNPSTSISDGAVTHLLNTGLSYVDNPDMVYGNERTPFSDAVNKVNGKWEIDCSSFTQAVFTGTTYENSSYFNGDNIYGRAFYPLVNHDRLRGRLLANQQAKYCYDNGYLFEPNDDYSNVRPGDLLFFHNSTEEGFWRDIGHVAVFVGFVENEGNAVILLDSSSGMPSAVNWHRRYVDQLKSGNALTAGRLPVPNVDNTPKKINFDGVAEYGIHTTEPLKPYRVYTLFFEADLPGDAYPIIYHDEENIYSFTASVNKRPDGVYKAVFYVTSENAPNYLRLSVIDSNEGVNLGYRALYEGYVTDMPAKETVLRPNLQHRFSKTIQLTGNENISVDFVEEVNAVLDEDNYYYHVEVSVSGVGATTVLTTVAQSTRKHVALYNVGTGDRDLTVHYTLTQTLKGL